MSFEEYLSVVNECLDVSLDNINEAVKNLEIMWKAIYDELNMKMCKACDNELCKAGETINESCAVVVERDRLVRKPGEFRKWRKKMIEGCIIIE